MAKKNMVKKRVNKTLESQLLGTLFVTIFEWFPLQSDRLKQVKTIETACLDLEKGDRDLKGG